MFCKFLEESYSEFFKKLRSVFYEKYQLRVLHGVTEEQLKIESNFIKELVDDLLFKSELILKDSNFSKEAKITKVKLLLLITDFLNLYEEFFITEEFDIYKKLVPLKINQMLKGDVAVVLSNKQLSK